MIITTVESRDVLSRWMALAEHLEGVAGIEDLVADSFKAREALVEIEGKVATNSTEYKGDGSHPFLVSGRVSGDDDDTALLILADDPGTADDVFKYWMIEEAELEVDEDENPIDEMGNEISIYINSCSQIG